MCDRTHDGVAPVYPMKNPEDRAVCTRMTRVFVGFLAFVALGGCGPGFKLDLQNGGGPCSAGPPPNEDRYQVLEAMNQSYHELVVCGGVTTSFTRTLLLGGVRPDHLRWAGDGRFVTGGDGTQMTIEVLAHGRPIGSDSFAALLLDRAALELRVDVVVKDEKDGAVIAYHMASPVVPVEELSKTKKLPWQLIDASASRGDQQVSIANWDVVYLDGALDGRIDVKVTGGADAYDASLAYAKAAYADVTLSCGR
jgi:hypothetical protein